MGGSPISFMETSAKLSLKKPSELLAMKVPEADKYLPNGIFSRGQPFAIVGPAGVGKSRLSLQLIVCLLTGKPFLGWPVKKHKAKWLIVQTENGVARMQADIASMRQWIGEKAFADVDSNLLLHPLITEHDGFLSMADPFNQVLLDGLVYEAQPDFVLFDPLNAFSSGNLNTDAGMLETCRGLQQLVMLRRPQATIVICHHSLAGKAGLKKLLGQDEGSYAKGSKAFTQWIRGQLNIGAASDDGSDLVVVCGKNSNGPKFPPFGITLNPATMVYEVNPDFDLDTWKASVGVETMASQPKLDADAVAELTGPLPVLKVELTKRVMDEWAVGKSRAYKVIQQAITSGKIVRDARKGFRTP